MLKVEIKFNLLPTAVMLMYICIKGSGTYPCTLLVVAYHSTSKYRFLVQYGYALPQCAVRIPAGSDIAAVSPFLRNLTVTSRKRVVRPSEVNVCDIGEGGKNWHRACGKLR